MLQYITNKYSFRQNRAAASAAAYITSEAEQKGVITLYLNKLELLLKELELQYQPYFMHQTKGYNYEAAIIYEIGFKTGKTGTFVNAILIGAQYPKTITMPLEKIPAAYLPQIADYLVTFLKFREIVKSRQSYIPGQPDITENAQTAIEWYKEDGKKTIYHMYLDEYCIAEEYPDDTTNGIPKFIVVTDAANPQCETLSGAEECLVDMFHELLFEHEEDYEEEEYEEETDYRSEWKKLKQQQSVSDNFISTLFSDYAK